MVKALARAFPWQRMLDDGVCSTLLAPDEVEAILDGRQPDGLRLEDLLDGIPAEWAGQGSM